MEPCPKVKKPRLGQIDCSAQWRLPASIVSTLTFSLSNSSSVPSSARRVAFSGTLIFRKAPSLSLLTVLENGSAIETANIGREGAFRLFAAMYSRVSFNRCLVQLEGAVVRCPIELLQSEFKRSEQVRDLFVSYSETLLSQVQQTVACNAMHTTEERMCRWLLMMHDRAEGEALPYTHEFLSHMLGANRKSVTLAAQSLQLAGLISYRRGRIQVLDRRGLEKASCECYAIV
jgi:hypothetical protein